MAVALAVVVLGVAGIALIARAGSTRLPLLPVGASTGAQRDSAAMMMPARPVEYRLGPGLTAPADKARAYEFRPADSTAVTKLRDALGLKGDVKSQSGAWIVADGDRVLRVQNDAAMSWFFGEEMTRCGTDAPVSSDGSASSDALPPDYAPCMSTGVIVPDGAVSSGGGSSAGSAGSAGSAESSPPSSPNAEPCPMPPCPEGSACIQSCPKPIDAGPPPRPADLPSRAQAESIAREFFTRAGVGEAAIEVTDAYTAWNVLAHPIVDGLTTSGFEQSVLVGPKGAIVSAQGSLGRPKALGEYPLVGLTPALERLKTGFGGRGGPMPMGAPEPAIASDSGPAVTMIAPAPDGSPPPDAVRPDEMPLPDTTPLVVTITSVRLALELVHSFDSAAPSAHLIPAFVFGTDQGGTVSVLAVADEYLDTSGGVPYPGATEPGDTDPGGIEPAVKPEGDRQ